MEGNIKMQETVLRGKACVMPVAVAAGLGMAGMGLVSSGVVMADTTSATDTINVTVQPSCTFNSVQDKTYNGSAMNGTEVNNFTESGIHAFNLFCNDHNGFVVSATAYDLTAGVQDVIAYTNNYTHTGVNGMWTAEIASDTPGVTVVNQFVPMGGGTIISSDSNTSASGADFTASYSAYVGTETPAGTYTGTIVYTLTAAGTSNSNSGNNGGSGSGGTEQNDNNGENGGDNGGTNSGNEVTDNSGSGDSGTGGSGTGGTGTGDAGANTDPGSEQQGTNSTPSNSPLMLNSSSPTYNTSNTYNTTNNYSGGSGTSMPAVASTQGTTSGTTSDTTSGSGTTGSNNSGANSKYEQPLGVTTSTSSSNEESGIDPMPMVATGAILAVAGVAAVALAKSDKKEEEKQ